MDRSSSLISLLRTFRFNLGKNTRERSTLSPGTWSQRIHLHRALGMARSKLYVCGFYPTKPSCRKLIQRAVVTSTSCLDPHSANPFLHLQHCVLTSLAINPFLRNLRLPPSNFRSTNPGLRFKPPCTPHSCSWLCSSGRLNIQQSQSPKPSPQ